MDQISGTSGTSGDAAAANRELTEILVDAGRRSGLEPVIEYQVPGGRLDVVWMWTPPYRLPGVTGQVPVVGFEVESSWRTRKHVKGDLLNLQDAGVAVGVIVLADGDPRDASLRQFAVSLVDRPGPTMLVWTHEDVRSLAGGGDAISAIEAAAVDAAATPSDPVDQSVHRGKYRSLWAWLRGLERTPFRVSFSEVERAVGLPLPNSCRAHVSHWYSYQGSAVARAIIDAGWHVSRVDLNAQELTFVPSRR